MAQSNGQAVLITSAFTPTRTDSAESSSRSEFDLKNFERLPARDVPVHALSAGISLRQGGTDAAHIELLLGAADSEELPPILVQLDGYRVIDGLHRLEAAKLRGDSSIKARFLDCSNAEALVIAMKANGSHGLPLSKSDRLSGAQRVLSSHPDWSDRAIAQITGLSAKTIASLRHHSADGAPHHSKRIGRDGRRRPVDASEGRLRAAEYIAAHPDAPLRQVATETDVSLGTVHDVKARLRRGDSPERDGRRTADAPSPAVQPVSVQHIQHTRHTEHAEHAEHAAVVPAVQPVHSVRSVPEDDEAEAPGRCAAVPGTAGRVPASLAPSVEAAPPQRRNHTEAPPAWATVAAKMASDPAIRYTAGGREFLRWMQLHATDPDEKWRGLVDAVPAHWLGVVAPIAERIGREWSLLAEQLRTRQEVP